MAERIVIFEGPLASPEGFQFGGVISIEVDDDKPTFNVHTQILQYEPRIEQMEVVKSDLSFEISNPIEVGVLALWGAKSYGLCVGWRMARFTMRSARKSYRASRSETEKLPAWDRTKDVAKRLGGMGQDFKEEGGNALLDCIPFSKWFSGDEKEQAPPDSPPPDI